jgi:toxin CcdB
MRQFDIVQLSDRSLAVVLQTDLLDELSSRVVAPLLREPTELPESRLHPRFRVGRHEYALLTDRLAAIPSGEITKVVRSAKDREWDLRRALDIVFVGV